MQRQLWMSGRQKFEMSALWLPNGCQRLETRFRAVDYCAVGKTSASDRNDALGNFARDQAVGAVGSPRSRFACVICGPFESRSVLLLRLLQKRDFCGSDGIHHIAIRPLLCREGQMQEFIAQAIDRTIIILRRPCLFESILAGVRIDVCWMCLHLV